jgi:hypothetical protein
MFEGRLLLESLASVKGYLIWNISRDMELPPLCASSKGMHELSSLARKPGSWVRIPHKACMFGVCVCVYSVFVLSCV